MCTGHLAASLEAGFRVISEGNLQIREAGVCHALTKQRRVQQAKQAPPWREITKTIQDKFSFSDALGCVGKTMFSTWC